MVIVFVVILVLTAILLSQNVRYAMRTYLANRQRVVFSVYLLFLIIFGALVIHMTGRVIDIIEDVREFNRQEAGLIH